MTLFSQFSKKDSGPWYQMTLALISLSLFSGCYLKANPEGQRETVLTEQAVETRISFDPQNPNQEFLQAYAYLDLLDYTAELQDYIESHCQPTACTEEALTQAFDEIAENHPAARYFLTQRGKISAQSIRRGMSAQQWQKTQAALDQYRVRLKAIRSQMGSSEEIQALWQALTPTKDSASQERANAPSLSANMHAIQTIVETYAVDWGGIYPRNVWAMRQEASTSNNPYWKSITNPMTGKETEDQALMDYAAFRPGPHFQGRVLYLVRPDQLVYWIYGVDKDGELIQEQGQVLILTNS